MTKFLTPDEYNEVDAYTEEEVSARVESERQKWIEDSSKNSDNSGDEWKKKYDELSGRYDKRSDEYKNAKNELERRGKEVGDVKDEKKQAFEKIRDSYIDRAAGEDREYGEKLREQYERVGKETLDVSEIESALKDAHALALSKLNRGFSPFNVGSMTGEAPTGGEKKNERFTDTPEGKATYDYLKTVMGNN
jgi:hypothetical protein